MGRIRVRLLGEFAHEKPCLLVGEPKMVSPDFQQARDSRAGLPESFHLPPLRSPFCGRLRL